MHIVILSDHLPPDAPGGAGKVAWQLGQGLIAAGERVTFVTTTRGPSQVDDRNGIPVHRLRSRYPERFRAWLGLFNPLTVWPLNTLLRDLQPDIVHAHNVHFHLSYHSLVIGQYAGAATVFTAHDVMPFAYGKLTHFIDPADPAQCDNFDYRLPFGYNLRQMRLRWNPARNLSIRHTMYHFVDERVAVSHALKTALEANCLPPFKVVHNGVDPQVFAVPEAGVRVMRQRFKLEGRRVILFGGRLNRAKGTDQLLAALPVVKQRVPDVALLILGWSKQYVDQLRQRYPDLAEQIVYGGWLEGSELATAYRLADVVATPSVCLEAFMVGNIEGMAAGTPPITTCFGGPPEVVQDDETGFVVNPYNVDALADRLARLLADDALRGRMGEAGQRHVRENFTLARQVQAMQAIYQSALARKRGEEANS
jgi:glycosyltransferase involved in cell wall biosynthesis